jgi:FdhD protein
MLLPFQSVEIVRVRDGSHAAGIDRAATEEPLEIRLHGRPFSVIMRTPGADRELVAGFLLAEGVLRSSDDLATIESYTDSTLDHTARDHSQHSSTRHAPGTLHPENIVNVMLSSGSPEMLDEILANRRQVGVSSACGLCGRLTIESLRVDAPPLASSWTIDAATLTGLPELLRGAQTVFDETGGLHAAGLFTDSGQLDTMAEDVGRHNAVDKVIGRMLMRSALPLARHLLFVSGRTSFEIVQKAFLAGIPIVGAVSAPSSLAVDLAKEAGITLVGFLRGGSFNVYAHPQRISA